MSKRKKWVLGALGGFFLYVWVSEAGWASVFTTLFMFVFVIVIILLMVGYGYVDYNETRWRYQLLQRANKMLGKILHEE